MGIPPNGLVLAIIKEQNGAGDIVQTKQITTPCTSDEQREHIFDQEVAAVEKVRDKYVKGTGGSEGSGGSET